MYSASVFVTFLLVTRLADCFRAPILFNRGRYSFFQSNINELDENVKSSDAVKKPKREKYSTLTRFQEDTGKTWNLADSLNVNSTTLRKLFEFQVYLYRSS